MKVEDRIDEAIYQLEKIKDDIVDYDSCRDEALMATDALEQIYEILQDNKESMYADKSIVDQVIDKVSDIITKVIGGTNNKDLNIVHKKLCADIIQYLITKDHIETLSEDEQYGAVIRYVQALLDTDWYGILGDGVLKHFTNELNGNEIKLQLVIAYPNQQSKLDMIPIKLGLRPAEEFKGVLRAIQDYIEGLENG